MLNWRRPTNFSGIAKQVIEAIPRPPVFLIDQADSRYRLTGAADLPWEAFLYRAHPNKGAGVRIELAAELPYATFSASMMMYFLSLPRSRPCSSH